MKTNAGGRTLILIPSPRSAELTGELLEGASIDDAFVDRLAGKGRRRIPFEFKRDDALSPGGYRLEITAKAVMAAAADDQGRRNALVTVAEMVRQTGGLAAGRIEDRPEFEVRAVIEGYCGKPWPQEGRLRTLEWMARRKFNVFFSSTRAPNASLEWRRPFDEAELAEITAAVDAARQLGIDYVYSIRPADITISDEGERRKLLAKIRAVFDAGVRRFMLCQDDIYQDIAEPDAGVYGDYGTAHAALAAEVYGYLKGLDAGSKMVFCPIPYLTMHARRPDRREYLARVKERLPEEIDLIWTGPYCCSARITAPNARYYGSLIGRKPFLWDNYPVVDGRPGILYLGPIRQRDRALAGALSGYGTNPMDYPVLNFIPVSTIAEFLWNPAGYSPETAMAEAIEAELGAAALPAARRLVEIFSPDWSLPEITEGLAGSTDVHLRSRGSAEAAAHLDAIGQELDELYTRLEGLTDNGEFLEELRPQIDNLIALHEPVALDVEIERLRGAGKKEAAGKLEGERAAMLEHMEADLDYKNVAAISYLRGNWRYFRELTGDTSTTI